MNNETEKALSSDVTALVDDAENMAIVDKASYDAVADRCRNVKSLIKKVKDYWEPLRISTKKAYDDVLAKKKEMLDPLDATEKRLKGLMSEYLLSEERKRREEEEAYRRQLQAAVDAKLDEAILAGANGDALGAEGALEEAELLDNQSVVGAALGEKTKADGVSTRRTWEIESINDAEVPISFNGTCIRPVDEKAVLAIIKASDGKVVIPGVKFKESITLSVRAS